MLLDRIRERHGPGQAHAHLYEAMDRFDRRHGLEPHRLRPQDPYTLRRDGDREPARELLKQFEELPSEQRRKLPALYHAMARMRAVCGDLDGALSDLHTLSTELPTDPEPSQEVGEDAPPAEAPSEAPSEDATQLRLEMLGVALDQGKEDIALEVLRTLGGEAFSGYEFISLLGSGFSGSSWLCREKSSGRALVLKAAFDSSLDTLEAQRTRERNLLREVEHPAIELPEPEGNALFCAEAGAFWLRPFVSGESLYQRVRRGGPLSGEEWFPIAWTVLSALRDLHIRGMIHRAICPGHVILTNNEPDLAAILIDSGESPKRTLIHALMANQESQASTRLGRSAARRVPFLAPEASGRPKGTSWFGPPMDIYSFGLLGWYALTGSPYPLTSRKEEIDPAWREILDKCTQWIQGRRPMMVEAVMDLVRKLGPLGETSSLDEGIRRGMKRRAEELVNLQPENAEARVRFGRTLVRLDDTEGALMEFQRALALQPDLASAHVGSGLTHMLRMDMDKAVEELAEGARLEPERHEIHAHLAVCLGKLGRHQDALLSYEKAHALVPAHPGIQCEIGETHLTLGQAPEALAHFAMAIKTDPSNIRARCGQARAFLSQGETAKGMECFEAALKIEPHSQTVLIERSQELLHLGQNEKALVDIHRALALTPLPRADLRLNEAYALHKMGRDEAALESLGQALKDFPASKPLRILFGEILLRLNRHQEAIEGVLPILNEAPESAIAHHVYGASLLALGNATEGLIHLDRALELDPTMGKSRFHRGLIRAQSGDSKGAAEDFAHLVETDPDDAACRSNLANALTDQGLTEEALVQFETGMIRNPGDPHLQMGMSRLKTLKGDKAGALALYNSILMEHPDFTLALVARSQSRSESGEKAEALEDIERALGQDPENPGFLAVRGAALATSGDFPGAIADFELAHQSAPNQPGFLHNLAMARQSGGQYQAAADSWKKYVDTFEDNSHARLSLASNLALLGRIGEAMHEASVVVEHSPEMAEARMARADLAVMSGNYPLALFDLDRYLKKLPDDIQGLLKRAQILNRLSLHEDAIADGSHALSLDPNMPRTLNNQGWTLAICPRIELRNPTLARELAQKAVDLTQGRDFGIIDTFAVAIAATGDLVEATRVAQEAQVRAPEGYRRLFERRLATFAKGLFHDFADDEEPGSVPVQSPASGKDLDEKIEEGEVGVEPDKSGDADVGSKAHGD